jgi:putative FmdB family regulatory protein
LALWTLAFAGFPFTGSIMPIYAYKCASCGHAKDVLQRMSDDPLTVCPSCGQATFQKQLTAAGFQLKGSGWYVTDFRGGSSTGAPAPATGGSEAPAQTSAAAESPAPATPAPAPAATSSTPAPAKPAT